MNGASQACPHCGSHNHRLLADHVGRVGWCRDCHRTWEAAQARTLPPMALCREALPPRERRSA